MRKDITFAKGEKYEETKDNFKNNADPHRTKVRRDLEYQKEIERIFSEEFYEDVEIN